MLGGSIVACPIIHIYASRPSGGLLIGIGQVGATLLIAYGVEISWLLKESRIRSSNRENWAGVASGISGCGMLGIAIALGLSTSGDSLSWIESLGFTWVLFSLGSLGGLVAMLPLALYEWTHAARTEYADE